jgi:hypothetical protein
MEDTLFDPCFSADRSKLPIEVVERVVASSGRPFSLSPQPLNAVLPESWDKYVWIPIWLIRVMLSKKADNFLGKWQGSTIRVLDMPLPDILRVLLG